MASPSSTPTATDAGSSQTAPAEQGDGTRKATLPPGYDSSSAPSNDHPSSPKHSSGSTRRHPSPLSRLWRTIKSIYYASTPAWQFLKSGALLLFGLFCWSAANLLLSYEPSWHWPYFFMAYGFLLIPYGPFTHFVLVPHVIPWLRRCARDSWLHVLGRHLTLTSLTFFFGAVLGMGAYPPAIMQIDFRATNSSGQADINPTLVCSKSSDPQSSVSCRLNQTTGVGFITVESGGTQILRRDEPPYSFSLRRSQLVEVVNQHQFQVVVHDDTDAPVRRFNRTFSMIR